MKGHSSVDSLDQISIKIALDLTLKVLSRMFFAISCQRFVYDQTFLGT